jgi:ankyrin repeat protein
MEDVVEKRLKCDERVVPKELILPPGPNEKTGTVIHINGVQPNPKLQYVLLTHDERMKCNEALIDACTSGNFAEVQMLLGANADVHTCRDAPIEVGCKSKNTELVKMLLDANANPSAGVNDACRAGNVDNLKLLIAAKADLSKCVEGCAFSSVCEKGHVEMCKFLISEEIPIHQDCLPNASDTGNAELVKILIDGHADVDTADRFGDLPLQKACRNNHLAVAKILIEANARVYVDRMMEQIFAHDNVEILKLVTDPMKRYVIHCGKMLEKALISNSASCVEWLLKANVNLKDVDQDVLVKSCSNATIRQLLVNAGYDLQGYYDWSMCSASKEGNLEAIKALIEKKANVQNNKYIEPLDYAVFNQQYDVVNFLLTKIPESSGWLLNTLCCEANDPKMVKLLLREKAGVDMALYQLRKTVTHRYRSKWAICDPDYPLESEGLYSECTQNEKVIIKILVEAKADVSVDDRFLQMVVNEHN